MKNIQELFDYMKAEIEHISKEESEAISKEIASLEKEIDESAYNQAKKDAEVLNKIENEKLSKESSIAVSKAHVEMNKKLIQKRESYVDALFDEVKDKLTAFTETNEYVTYLEDKVKSYKDLFTSHCTVYLRKEDMQYKDLLLKILDDADIETDDAMTLGGLKIKDADKLIDDSFENQLFNSRKWFVSHSNLLLTKGDEVNG